VIVSPWKIPTRKIPTPRIPNARLAPRRADARWRKPADAAIITPVTGIITLKIVADSS
jgi:hypothetical protein